MKLEHKFLIIALLASILAVPVALATQHRAHLLRLEKAENSTLHIQLNSAEKELQLKNTQLEQEKKLKQEQQQKIEDLQKQVQARAAAKAAALLASYQTPNCAAYRGLVAQYDWPVQTAMAIMQAESGCRAITPDNSALNYDGIADHGLMQLHGMNITDPAENIRIAYAVKYLGAGRSFTPWSTYNNGAYLRYL